MGDDHTMWCTNCGHKLMEAARFCDKCGATQTPPPVVQHTIPTPPMMQNTIPVSPPAMQSTVPAPPPIAANPVPPAPASVGAAVSGGAATRPLIMAKLVLPNAIEVELPFEGSFKMGRSDGSAPIDLDLTEMDTDVFSSRRHAEIIVRFGEYYLKDLGSRNGTYINDKKIGVNEEVKLNDQDRIILGRVQLTFRNGL